MTVRIEVWKYICIWGKVNESQSKVANENCGATRCVGQMNSQVEFLTRLPRFINHKSHND